MIGCQPIGRWLLVFLACRLVRLQTWLGCKPTFLRIASMLDLFYRGGEAHVFVPSFVGCGWNQDFAMESNGFAVGIE
jgi:hypothetical protein